MDLNTILIIAGIIVLIGLVAHGLWANRREKSKYFESANAFERDAEQAAAMQQQGISTQTVNRPAFTESPPLQSNTAAQNTAFISSMHNQAGNPPQPQTVLQTETQPEYGQPTYTDNQPMQSSSFDMPQTSQAPISEPQSVEQIKITLPDSQPLDVQSEQSATQAEPQYYHYRETAQNISNMTIADTEQFDEDEGINTSSVQLRVQLQEAAQGNLQKTFAAEQEEPQATASNEDTTFITLYVVAAENHFFQGAILEQALDTLGFKLGQDKLYHNHLNLDETEPVLFSVANITHPGTFALNRIADFTTQGVVLFMRLPSVGNDRVNLKMMIRAADQLAKILNGFVLTDRQEIFTEAAETEYLARLD